MPNLCNSGKPREALPLPEHSGRLAMAAKAQGLNVFKITLASPLDHRHDVIGLPNALSYPRFQSPVEHQPYTVVAAGTLQLAQRPERVYKTTGTDAAVPKEDLFAEVGRLRAKFPFMDAVGRAKGEATGWHFERAPTAETAAVRTSGDRAAIDPSPFHHPEITHSPVLAVGQQLINAKDDTSLDPAFAAAFTGWFGDCHLAFDSRLDSRILSRRLVARSIISMSFRNTRSCRGASLCFLRATNLEEIAFDRTPRAKFSPASSSKWITLAFSCFPAQTGLELGRAKGQQPTRPIGKN